MSSRSYSSRERGQVVVLFALLIPMILALGGAVIGIGNWYVHAKNLQTKADAGAFAGGNAWSFPCSGNTDTTIISQAQRYAGPSTSPPATSVGLNPQVGGVPSTKIHTVLNGTDWYDDDTSPAPTQWNSPPSDPTGGSGALCASKILDVKVTEDNSFPLASLIPLFPDIKRKARVRIEEGSGFSGLLPIAVRVPKPVSAAAIYVNETPGLNTFGHILAAHYFNDICEPPNFADCLASIPGGLDQWTTATDPVSGAGNQALVSGLPAQTGVVVALSFRPKCPGPNPCFDATSATDINTLCNQGTSALVQCFYATQSGGNQTFQSGLQFIGGYDGSGNVTNTDPPKLRRVWLDGAGGTYCYNGGYFSAPGGTPPSSCTATLHADVDAGGRPSDQVQVRYQMVYGGTSAQGAGSGSCGNNYGPNCDLSPGAGGFAGVTFDSAYARDAFAIRVRLVSPAVVGTGAGATACNSQGTNCQWYFTAQGPSGNSPTADTIFNNPVQRAFMGNLDRSGPVKYLRLHDVDCSTGAGDNYPGNETGQAASLPEGTNHCFRLELGLQGALAREQDEYPIQLNIGATSQSAVVDCDPNVPNLKTELQLGCQHPNYAKHDFASTPYCPSVSGAPQFFSTPKAAPWQNWGANNGAGPFTCVITQASANPNQVGQGLSLRFFGVANNPNCPADSASFVAGRNYWHDYNNSDSNMYDPDGSTGPMPPEPDYFTFARTSRGHGNHLRNDDPRLVLLFITPYNSFTNQGNETFPISLIGGFYITGYGSVNGNGNLTIEDPCADGAPGGPTTPTSPYAGNTPPPDLDANTSSEIAWGHFITPVDLGTSTGGTGVLCQQASLTACVAVLVE